MKRAVCFAVFLASLFEVSWAASAHAEVAATASPEVECARCRTYPMSFGGGSQVFKGGTADGRVLRVDGFVRFMFTYRPWLVIGVGTHIGRTFFTYSANNVDAKTKDAAKTAASATDVKVDLSTKAYVTIEPTIQGRLHEFDFPRIRTRLSLWLHGTFETQLNLGDELNINTVTLETSGSGKSSSLDLTPFVRADPTTLKMHYQFNRYELGGFARLEWHDRRGRDRVNVEMRVAWQRLDSRVTIIVNQQVRDIASAKKLDPTKIEGGFSLQNDAPIFLPEVSVRLVGNFWLKLSAAAAPVNGTVFAAGRLELEYRLNP